MTFPKVSAKNLESRVFVLPRDFESQYNVVVFAFIEAQQLDVNTWMPFLNGLKERFALSVYELPTVVRGTWVWRRMLEYWMVTGIPDPSVRATTITLHLDVNSFIQQLGFSNINTIYTAIVDREGRLYWHIDGAFSPEKGASLIDTLRTLLPTSV